MLKVIVSALTVIVIISAILISAIYIKNYEYIP